MSRVPELYIPSEDEAARAEGSVYIADLMADHVLIALKQNCAPQGLGFIYAEPVTAEYVNELHDAMTEALAADADLLRRGFNIGQIIVESEYGRPDEVVFRFDYWDGRPMRLAVTSGIDSDKNLLTGFKPFNPRGFDHDQGTGAAQKSVDALRATGDPMSFEVQALEGGRTFENAKNAQAAAIGFMDQALSGEAGDLELGITLSEALDKVHRQIEGS
ncbi:MAG TPA: hypothetical protein VLE69_03325 [Candidatus Saccharimonadales bacterium]|nr:hypothetical protein [Candidatus Saccharimonadales bacterium]